MRLHDALKVATEGVLHSASRTRDQDGGFQGWVVVVEKGFHWPVQKGRVLETLHHHVLIKKHLNVC